MINSPASAATQVTAATASAGPAVFARGLFVVANDGSELPRRCVRCNSPAHGSALRTKLSWLHAVDRQNRSAIGALASLGGLLTGLLGAIVGGYFSERSYYKNRQQATIHVHLCRRHKILRYGSCGFACMITLVAVALPFYTFTRRTMNPLPLLGSVALFAMSVGVLLWGIRLLRAHHIGGGTVTLAGACKPFVAQLPRDPTPSTMAASIASLPPRPARPRAVSATSSR